MIEVTKETVAYYTITDVSVGCGIPYQTLWALIAAGQLPGPTHVIGRRKYYTAEERDGFKNMVERYKADRIRQVRERFGA